MSEDTVQQYACSSVVNPDLPDDDPEALRAVIDWQEWRMVEDLERDGFTVLEPIESTLHRAAPWAVWDEVPRRWWERLLRRPVRRLPPPAMLVSVTKVARLPVSPGERP